MFVVALDGKLYVGKKQQGFLHHSSFLAGGPCICAGMISVTNGVVDWLMPHSGHYRPRAEHVFAMYHVLERMGVDMTRVKIAKPAKWKGPWPEFPAHRDQTH